MAYTPEERETYYSFSDDSDVCYIYTCNKTLMKKFDKFCLSHPNEYKCVKQDDCSKSYVTKKKYISARVPKTISKEHKEKLQRNIKTTDQ